MGLFQLRRTVTDPILEFGIDVHVFQRDRGQIRQQPAMKSLARRMSLARPVFPIARSGSILRIGTITGGCCDERGPGEASTGAPRVTSRYREERRCSVLVAHRPTTLTQIFRLRMTL